MSVSQTIDIPELSRQAWQRMLEALDDSPPCETALPAPSLRLSAMPEAAQVLQTDPAIWVAAYEKALAAVSRKARKKGALQSGVFYTPLPVARYLVQQTLGVQLQVAAHAIRSARQTGTQEATELARVQALRIIDPACGTGVFLLAALEALHEFYTGLQMPNAAQIALAQLHGIDIDPLAVWIGEARLYQAATQLAGSEPDLSPAKALPNVQAGDALQAALFDERWDLVLGNPPYVSEVRGQAGLFRALKAADSPYYRAKMDLCDAFLAWAMDHLASDGALAYVLPEYWMQRTSTAALRQRLWQEGQIRELWTFPDQGIFEAAPGHHTSLLIWQRAPKDKPLETPLFTHAVNQANITVSDSTGMAPSWCRPLKIGAGVSEPSAVGLQEGRIFLDPQSGKLAAGDSETIALLARLSNLSPLLRPEAIQQGIVLPQGRLKKADLTQLENDRLPAGLFLLTTEEIETLGLNNIERTLLRPWYGPTGFQPFTGFPPSTTGQSSASEPQHWLIYMHEAARKRLQSHPAQYPNLKAHFDLLAPLNTSAFAPYGLHRARQPEWFEGAPRILCPRQVVQPACAVVDHPVYVGEGFYVIRPSQSGINHTTAIHPHISTTSVRLAENKVAENRPNEANLMTALLNSRLAWFWFYHQKRKGQRLQIDKDVLCAFPAPPDGWRGKPETAQLASCARQLASSLSVKARNGCLAELNTLVEGLYALSAEESRLLAGWTL